MRYKVLLLSAVVGVLAMAGCQSAAQQSGAQQPAGQQPADNGGSGDIPDNQAYVEYRPASGRYAVKIPEGWARTESGDTATFTDKLNTITIAAGTRATAPDEASGRADLDTMKGSVKGFAAGAASTVHRPAGDALLVTYRADAEPDPVTGKVVSDDVERYQFWHAGQLVTLTVAAPHGADNVDPWRTVTDSLRWLP
jgi:hypothetical protein